MTQHPFPAPDIVSSLSDGWQRDQMDPPTEPGALGANPLQQVHCQQTLRAIPSELGTRALSTLTVNSRPVEVLNPVQRGSATWDILPGPNLMVVGLYCAKCCTHGTRFGNRLLKRSRAGLHTSFARSGPQFLVLPFQSNQVKGP